MNRISTTGLTEQRIILDGAALTQTVLVATNPDACNTVILAMC